MKPTFTQNSRILPVLSPHLFFIFFYLVFCLVLQSSGAAEKWEWFLRKGERCSDILGHAGKVMPGSPDVMGLQETLLVNFQVTTKTLDLIGDLCGRMKCLQSRVWIWSVYAKDAKLRKYADGLWMLLNMGKTWTLSSLEIKQLSSL